MFTIGIDLYSALSTISALEGDHIKIIDSIPSCFSFTDEDCFVGTDAIQRMHQLISFYDIISIIGYDLDDQLINEKVSLFPFKVYRYNFNFIEINVILNQEYKKFYPEQILAMHIKKIMTIAEAQLHHKIDKAVISIPHYFNQYQIETTKKAFTLANLKIADIIIEPIAAALAFGLNKKKESHALIIDTDREILSLSILDIYYNKVMVHAMLSNIDLSMKNYSRSITYPFIDLDKSIFVSIDTISNQPSKFYKAAIEKLFLKANINEKVITDVILVKGSKCIQQLLLLVQQLFNFETLNNDIEANNVFAYGAAVQIQIIEQNDFEKIEINDIGKIFSMNENNEISSSYFNEFFKPYFLENHFDLDNFLKASKSIEICPIKALIWAYSKYPGRNISDSKIIELLYNESRKTNIDKIIFMVDNLFKEFFFNFKYAPSHMAIFISNTLMKIMSTDFDSKISFLSKFYSNYGINDSLFSRAICISAYGMEGVLKPIIHHFENVEQIKEKTKGVQFGRIIKSKGKLIFLKAHQNYPFVGAVQNPISLSSYTNAISVQGRIVNKVLSVDLKELFAYKVIERLQYGPKTTFVLNENLISGLFICTEEIINFETINAISCGSKGDFSYIKNTIDVLKSKMQKDDFIVTGKDEQEILVQLTAFDIIVRCMMLTDLNINNIGFQKDTEPGVFKIKIVDFIRPLASSLLNHYKMILEIINQFKNISLPLEIKEKKNKILKAMNENKYIYATICDNFIEADRFTKYPEFLLGTFVPIKSFDQNISDKFINQKIAFGKLALRLLPSNFKSIIEQVYEEICKFSKGKEFQLGFQYQLDSNEAYPDPLSDLLYYKDAILDNFKVLTTFIRDYN